MLQHIVVASTCLHDPYCNTLLLQVIVIYIWIVQMSFTSSTCAWLNSYSGVYESDALQTDTCCKTIGKGLTFTSRAAAVLSSLTMLSIWVYVNPGGMLPWAPSWAPSSLGPRSRLPRDMPWGVAIDLADSTSHKGEPFHLFHKIYISSYNLLWLCLRPQLEWSGALAWMHKWAYRLHTRW